MRLTVTPFVLTAVIALPFLFSATNAHAQSYGTNIIVNGNAESGPGSTDGSVVPSIPGWTSTGQFTVNKYGASGGFPETTDPGPTARGLNFFAGGNVAVSTGSQTISVSDDATEIDTGKVKFALSAYLGGFSSQEDHASVTVVFEDGTGKTIKTVYLGPISQEDRKGVTGLFPCSTHGVVLAGTRSIGVTLTMTRFEGEYNDGYADNLSLILTKPVVKK